MTYFGELRTNWRPLSAASLGQAAGYSLVNYVANIFTPHLIDEFGWSSSDIALVSSAALFGILCQPIAGRFTDLIGVRRMALVGVVTAPVVFLGLGTMTGALGLYFLLFLVQITVVGSTTGPAVYSRLIAQQFDRARGVALAIAACAAPAARAAIVPFLSRFIDASGWRAGYAALAAGTAVAGISAILLIPPSTGARQTTGLLGRDSVRDYGAIVRSHPFRLIVAGVMLCNLSFMMQTTQLKVILLGRGFDSTTASWAISLFAFSVIVGRLLCGFALDRFPTYAVAAISLGLPGLGLAILATGSASPTAIGLAVLLLGLALGSEGDLLAYVVMRFFDLAVYSTVLGLVLGALALSVSLGSLLLSLFLELGPSFTPFLILSAIAALTGSGMFLRLRRVPPVSRGAPGKQEL